MNSFIPSKYSSTYEESIDVSEEIVEKGHKNVLKVDLDKFNEMCKNFKEIKDMKIKNLTGKNKEEFDLAVSYVHLLYGTAYYNQLYEKVKTHFKNVSSIKAGTVGGYFAGCLKANGNGCSLACAGSMPLPKDEDGWSQCDKAVIMAEKAGESYNFSVIKPGNTEEEMDPAYVFVENNFEGFNEVEKENLKAMGCKKVKLISYSSDMRYSEVYGEPRELKDIKKRKRKDKKEDSNWLWLIVLLLVLILVLCVVGYKYRS